MSDNTGMPEDTDLNGMLNRAEEAIKRARAALADEHDKNLRDAIEDLHLESHMASRLVNHW